jgi:uncharacterized protein DUF4331
MKRASLSLKQIRRFDFMRFNSHRALIAATALTAIVAAGCGDKVTAPTAATPRAYDQVQRLGNPLVSEVFLLKKDHPYHGSIGPAADVAAFTAPMKAFVAQFRPLATTAQNTLAAVLLPDMLIIQTDKDPATAGWLSWALANGWGGRKLSDDVVDTGLTAIFSSLLDPTQAACAPFTLPLCTDNVGSHATFATTFPYLGVPK